MEYLGLEILFDNPEWEEILIAELAGIGFSSFSTEEKTLRAYITSGEFDKEKLKTCFFINANSDKLKISSQTIKPENWNRKWEENFEPVNVEDKIYIRAPFHEPRPEIAIEILIMPKMAFGTGHHATTYLMLKQMLGLDLKNKTVADLGCGSGILAIAASKLGAKEIAAVDIDEWSYKNTIENARVNNVKNMVIKQGSAEILQRKFNVVLANINRNVLLAEMKIYHRLLHDKGLLLLSGFYTGDNSAIDGAAAGAGLELEKEMERNNWLSLLYRKR